MGRITGCTLSMVTAGTMVTKQNGSSFSKCTVPGRVNFQFMVKLKGSQPVSTSPSSGWMPSLMRLGEPRTDIIQSGSVLNR